MKLRNKKTGEILDLSVGFIKDTYNGEFIQIKAEAISTKEGYLYGSLAKLNEDWEDYTPSEPLIKDEKIRKAVRAWAEASGITKVLSYGDYFWLGFRSVNTESVWKFECSYSDAFEFELDKEYTITELCGEEKE